MKYNTAVMSEHTPVTHSSEDRELPAIIPEGLPVSVSVRQVEGLETPRRLIDLPLAGLMGVDNLRDEVSLQWVTGYAPLHRTLRRAALGQGAVDEESLYPTIQLGVQRYVVKANYICFESDDKLKHRIDWLFEGDAGVFGDFVSTIRPLIEVSQTQLGEHMELQLGAPADQLRSHVSVWDMATGEYQVVNFSED